MDTFPYPVIRATAAALLLVVSACSPFTSGRGSEGPFLRAGPIGAVPGVRAAPAIGYREVLHTRAGIPAGFTEMGGMKALPEAELPGVGPVRALVVSVSLGSGSPYYTDTQLLHSVFGDDVQEPGTLANDLYQVSGGKLRFTAAVLPTLVDPRKSGASELSEKDIRRLAVETVETWARDTTLVQFDNEGPDGIPFSRDDDHMIDMLFLAVETDGRLPSVTVAGDFSVPTPQGDLKVGQIHFFSLPRNEDLKREPAHALVMGALGMDVGEAYFPGDFPRTVSSVARARLGWLPMNAVLSSGTVVLKEGQSVVLPLLDLAGGAGFWLVEKDDRRVYASRLARKMDGHYFVSQVQQWGAGGEQVLALNRQLGTQGPRAYVTWSRGSAEPSVEVLKEGGERRAPALGTSEEPAGTVIPRDEGEQMGEVPGLGLVPSEPGALRENRVLGISASAYKRRVAQALNLVRDALALR